MSRRIYTFIILLTSLTTSSVYAEGNWDDTKKSVKSGSHNIALTSKTVWNDTKKISINFWHDTKDFSIDLWSKTKQSVHDATAPSKTTHN